VESTRYEEHSFSVGGVGVNPWSCSIIYPFLSTIPYNNRTNNALFFISYFYAITSPVEPPTSTPPEGEDDRQREADADANPAGSAVPVHGMAEGAMAVAGE